MIKKASNPETGFITLRSESVTFSIVRSKRRKKTIAFKVGSDGIRILAPVLARLGSIEKILQKRTAWLLREFINQKKINEECTFTNGSVFRYLGHACPIKITLGEDAPQSCCLTPHNLHVHVPDEGLSQENMQQEVKLEIMLWIKKQARIKLKKRLDFWAERLGVRYKKLIVTDPERRWGSCSVDNIIRLNWRLMMTPLPILDYVVAHELCHVRHKNHARQFWEFLADQMPDYRERRKILRSVERGIMV